jgi:hypothetical protein
MIGVNQSTSFIPPGTKTKFGAAAAAPDFSRNTYLVWG